MRTHIHEYAHTFPKAGQVIFVPFGFDTRMLALEDDTVAIHQPCFFEKGPTRLPKVIWKSIGVFNHDHLCGRFAHKKYNKIKVEFAEFLGVKFEI
jgi:hypothetical protein